MAKGRVPGPLGLSDGMGAFTRRAQHAGRFAAPGPLVGTSGFSEPVGAARALVAREIDYELLYQDLVEWEGKVPWMYLDSKGLVTVGVGFYLKDVTQAQALPFINMSTGNPATADEIKSA